MSWNAEQRQGFERTDNQKKLFRKKLLKSFGSSKISLTFASAFRKKVVKEKSSLKDLDINKQVVQDYL